MPLKATNQGQDPNEELPDTSSAEVVFLEEDGIGSGSSSSSSSSSSGSSTSDSTRPGGSIGSDVTATRNAHSSSSSSGSSSPAGRTGPAAKGQGTVGMDSAGKSGSSRAAPPMPRPASGEAKCTKALQALDAAWPTPNSGSATNAGSSDSALDQTAALLPPDALLPASSSSNTAGCYSTMLLGLADALRQAEQPKKSLCFALAAAALDASAASPKLRVALALDRLGLPQHAGVAMREAVHALGPACSKADQQRLLGMVKSAHGARGKKGTFYPPKPKELQQLQQQLLSIAAGGQLPALGRLEPEDSSSSSSSSSSNAQDPCAVAATEAQLTIAAGTAASAHKSLQEGRYREAIELFHRGLMQLPSGASELAVLLSRRSSLRLQLGGAGCQSQALLDATAAVACDPRVAQAHASRVQALLALGRRQEAAEARQQGLQLLPGEPILERLLQPAPEAPPAPKPAPKPAPVTATSPQPLPIQLPLPSQQQGSSVLPIELEAEREVAIVDDNRGGSSGDRGLSLFNSLLAAAQGLGLADKQDMRDKPLMARAMQLETRVAPLHKEVEQIGGWPAQCDVGRCRQFLGSAYETARAINTHMLALDRVDPDVLLVRLGGPSKDVHEWWSNAPIGSIRFHARKPYHSGTLHSFRNTPPDVYPLQPGATHVAVGFLDLSDLAESCAQHTQQQSKQEAEKAAAAAPGLSPSAPLRWVGYDSSPYCVAKALVVAHMMRTQGAHATDAVLQVWYSAAWSKDTLAAFRTAVADLVAGAGSSAPQGQSQGPFAAAAPPAASGQPHEVTAWMRHWHDRRHQSVQLRKARNAWLDTRTGAGTEVTNYKRQADRVALGRYTVSGQLLGGEFGSSVMFDLPAGAAGLEPNEHFLQALDPREVADYRLRGDAPDMVAAGVLLLRKRIAALAELMSSGCVTVEVRHASVGLASPAALADIRSLAPSTMTWSNVPDYMSPREFHALARACSGGGSPCRHYLHAMNWTRDVKGGFSIDYVVGREGGGRKAQRKLQEDLLALLSEGQALISKQYHANDWQALLLDPPINNACTLWTLGWLCRPTRLGRTASWRPKRRGGKAAG